MRSTARSQSQVGQSGLGINAKRVRTFLRELGARLEARRAFFDLQREVTGAGGSAHVLCVVSENEAQKRGFARLFDRGPAYADLLREIQETGRDLRQRAPAASIQAVQRLRQTFDALGAIDSFPGSRPGGNGARRAGDQGAGAGVSR